ncbi:sialate O-acetylesterase [Planctomycetota bacterium]
MFCEGAVLQQGMPVPVWGTATPGADMAIDFAGQHVETKTDAQGNWTAVLEPLMASDQERTMMIRGGGKSVDIGKILVGEVWIGSGQSNMALTMKEADDGRTALPDATHPFIRVFKRPKGKKERESWHACTPSILEDFSAVAYFFGRHMHQNRHVPVGLIARSVGGTTIQRWIPQQACQGNPFIAAKMQEAERRKDEFARFEVEKGKYDKHNEPDGATVAWLAELSKLVYYRGQGYGGLYQRMIKPLQPYAIRGVIWYQGEFNNRSGQAYDYREWQATLVNSWRREWGQGSSVPISPRFIWWGSLRPAISTVSWLAILNGWLLFV